MNGCISSPVCIVCRDYGIPVVIGVATPLAVVSQLGDPKKTATQFYPATDTPIYGAPVTAATAQNNTLVDTAANTTSATTSTKDRLTVTTEEVLDVAAAFGNAVAGATSDAFQKTIGSQCGSYMYTVYSNYYIVYCCICCTGISKPYHFYALVYDALTHIQCHCRQLTSYPQAQSEVHRLHSLHYSIPTTTFNIHT
jgi:hypothetical protein